MGVIVFSQKSVLHHFSGDITVTGFLYVIVSEIIVKQRMRVTK